MLSLIDITKKYKDKVIFQNANFEAEIGEIVLLMGQSGIGKSTFLDIIAGIKSFDSGKYCYQNKEIYPKNDEQMSSFRNQTIGYILQDFALIDDYSVLENIILPSFYNAHMDTEDAKERARYLSDKFDLTEILHSKVKNISGGQKQRVAIVRSLILDPSIILDDEPTTNLDTKNFDFVMETFKELATKGKLIIIATHDERILTIADKVYQVQNYKLIV